LPVVVEVVPLPPLPPAELVVEPAAPELEVDVVVDVLPVEPP
jgi:hypothetical protein